MARRHREEPEEEGDWWDDEPLSTHRVGWGSLFNYNGGMWAWPIVFSQLGVVGFIMAAPNTPMSPDARSRLVWLIAAWSCMAAAVFFMLLCLMFWLRVKVWAVEVFEGGVTWYDSGWQAAAWDEIKEFGRAQVSEIVQGVRHIRKREVRIRARDGRRATFLWALSDWDTMANNIEERVTLQKIPAALEKYEAGESQEFGKKIKVSQDAIILDGTRYSWDEVESVQVLNAILFVNTGKKKEWSRKLAAIPDYPVLLKLLEMSPPGLDFD
jgi:hypothetical protein